jgi:RND superfamily putative drug exporter
MTALAGLTTGRISRFVVIAVWVVLLGAFAPLSAKLNSQKVDTSTSLLPEDSEAGRVAETLAKRFAGGDKPTTVLLYQRPGGLTAEDRQLIAENAQEAAKIPLAGTALPAFVDGKPAPQQVTRDGSTAFTVVPLAPGKSEQVAESIEELRALADDIPGLRYHVTGASALLNDINTAVESADVVLVLVTVLLVLALLLAIYRSPLLALIPLFVVIVSYVVASGIVYLLAKDGLKVDSTSTSLLLILMFGAGTDYCLLLVARYKEDLQRIEDQTGALRHAIPRAAPAIIASGLTVAAALLTLVASELDTNQTLGPVTAIGVAIVLVASITLLPAILGLIGRRGFWPTAKQVAFDASLSRTEYELPQGRWLRFGTWVLARPRTALIGGVSGLLICALGLFAWSPDPTPVKEFRTSPDSKQGYDVFAKAFPPGAVSPSTVLVERPGGTASDDDVKAVIAKLQGVDGVFAVFAAPEPRSADKRIARLGLVLDEDPLKPAALDRIDPLREAADDIGGGLRVQIGDGAARFHDQGVASERDLLVIAPLVLGVILIVLIVLLRALVAPLYLLATVVLSYLGTLGLSLLAFDVVFGRDGVDTLLPILAFIFLVALGVDYNIFLMSRIREEAALRGTREGILRGIVSTGPVITSAGLILAGTFIVLTTLPVWLLFELGFTVALGVLIDTFVVRTAVVPAITTMLGDRAWWPSKADAGGVVPAGSSPTIEVPALLGARKGVELLPAGLGNAGELVARANSDAERVELESLADNAWLARWAGRASEAVTRPPAEAVSGIRVLMLGPHAELERQNLVVRDLAAATGDRLPHLGLYRGDDGVSLLRQRVTGREPVMTLADRLAEDAARPEQAAATIDALLRLKLARWHFELARPPEPAELGLGQLCGIEATDPNWDAVERELGRAALEAVVAEERVALEDLERAVGRLVIHVERALLGPVHGALDGHSVLVDVNGRMELTRFGHAGIRWRALDFLSLERALKFDLTIQQVDADSLMRLERALETHGPSDRPRDLVAALMALPHGRRLAASAACVAAVRKAALECGAVSDAAQYRRGLALMTAALLGAPGERNLAYVVRSLAHHVRLAEPGYRGDQEAISSPA